MSATNTLNETLINNADDLSLWIKASSETAGKFAIEQAPLFIKEYLTWYFWGNVIELLTGVVFLILVYPLCLVFLHAAEREAKGDDYALPITVISLLAICIVPIVALILFFDSIPEIVKVTIAPRVVLVEKASAIFKGVK